MGSKRSVSHTLVEGIEEAKRLLNLFVTKPEEETHIGAVVVYQILSDNIKSHQVDLAFEIAEVRMTLDAIAERPEWVEHSDGDDLFRKLRDHLDRSHDDYRGDDKHQGSNLT